MFDKMGKKRPFRKVISESFPIKEGRGGLIKIEAWEDENGDIVRYNMAYINHAIFADDNGRVIGYDNAHNYHHKHYFGKIFRVENFRNYKELLRQFEKEIKEISK
jgi:hypothetical protein